MEQQENKTLKTRSFRISEETVKKFKEITDEIGGNQEEALAKLLETYEFQKGKVVLTDKKEEIQKFEQFINILTRMFMTALEDNQNAEVRIKGQFEALLNSKDSIIQDLKEQIAEKKVAADHAVEEAKKIETELDELKKTLTGVQNIVIEKEEAIKDKELLLEEITKNRDSYKDQVLSLLGQLEEIKETSKQIEQYEETIRRLEEKVHQKENEIEKISLEQERKILHIEREYQEELNKVKEIKTKEINEYQEKYKILLNTLEEKYNNQNNSIE